MSNLPDAKSPDLCLANPTPEERLAIWTANSNEWRGVLPVDAYLQREQHLLSAPLARDGGITHWILVSKDELPNTRAILASCESLRKPALISKDGSVKPVLTHGIGSVFCDPKYRGKGYAGRMMQEVGKKLRTWQVDPMMPGHEEIGFSILYSDIGKSFYSSHGWHSFPSTHISLPLASTSENGAFSGQVDSASATHLRNEDLPDLCAADMRMIQKQLKNAKGEKFHVALVPDIDAISWHHAREEFVCPRVFSGKTPSIRGAIAGEPGHRIWAIWTRSYYSPLGPNSDNTLHILRLVIEDELAPSSFSKLTGGPSYDEGILQTKAGQLKAILEVAKSEAKDWATRHVELWNPSDYVKMLVDRTGLEHSKVEREKESIASLMWYGEGKGGANDIVWLSNEKYGWC